MIRKLALALSLTFVTSVMTPTLDAKTKVKRTKIKKSKRYKAKRVRKPRTTTAKRP